MATIRRLVESYVRAHPDEAAEHVGMQKRPERLAGLSLSEIDAACNGTLQLIRRDFTGSTIIRVAEENNLLVDAVMKDLAIRVSKAAPMFEAFGYKVVSCDTEFGLKLIRTGKKVIIPGTIS